jgi:hypothetical protein
VPANPYNTVARDDFASMIAVDRYGRRSRAFDEIIARTEEHSGTPTIRTCASTPPGGRTSP